MSNPFAILDAPFAAMMRDIDAPGMTTAALKKTNDAHDAALAHAEQHKHARAEEYRKDLAKCSAALKDWLDTPQSRASVDDLSIGLPSEFGCDAASALDRGLLELAAQDIYDEQMGNE